MRVLPDRTVELLSTHDQLLGGASGQKYLGCVFPADPAYSRLISEPAMAVGGSSPSAACWGGSPSTSSRSGTPRTTGRRTRSSSTSARAGPPTPSSPCSTSSVGRTTATRGSTVRHRERPSTSSRPTTSRTTGSRALTTRDVFDVMARKRLHFDHSRKTGVVFHMLSCVTECGRLGMTAIGDSPERPGTPTSPPPRRCWRRPRWRARRGRCPRERAAAPSSGTPPTGRTCRLPGWAATSPADAPREPSAGTTGAATPLRPATSDPSSCGPAVLRR